ncbi:MBOAT family O-acyltransferase [Flavobacterium sp.]|uniref:MBOAT family O-acyltransferase n=1 Tax=Flavobacterium sp. TaxID=239 RepID=UPI0025CD85AE|nr:MBOAT family O-acyltransferase [Flavobacterium sp.]
MLFNSINFAIFLPIVFTLYWLLAKQNLRFQNILLLISSYFFYSCWDWRFLFLLIFSTVLDYFTAIQIAKTSNKKYKKFWFWFSITVNLGFLAVFKYYDFFITSFANAIAIVGINTNPYVLHVILPVGISFYTFHGLSYVIDIYNNRIKPEKNVIDYAVFVSFFPLLVAGPIERATHLLPQIKEKRIFDYCKAVGGMRQILWGLFKKIVIADQCAHYANMIFINHAEYSGSTLVLGLVFFSFQIYCDFSGYADIAIGTARLFGIDLLRNFAFPYFSRNIAEFWRRWHISLTTWFRDYIYLPLGGSKGGKWVKVRNVMFIFLVSGLWHGANWTYIIWGLLNGLYVLPTILFTSGKKTTEIVAAGKFLPTLKEFLSIILTFILTLFAWILFRSTSIKSAISYASEVFSKSLFTVPTVRPTKIFLLILIFMTIEWLGREEQFAIANVGAKWSKGLRWLFYYLLVLTTLYFAGDEQQFIYFQF